MLSITPSLLAFAVFLALYLLIFGALGLWVARDAAARESRYPRALGLGVACTGGLVALLYFVTRSGERAHGPTRGERVARTASLAALPAWAVAATVAPPDPVTQALYAVGLLAITVPAAYALDYRGRYARVP